MLSVQEFLTKSNNPLTDLTEKYGIKIRDYPEDNLLMLNYHMIDSPKTDPITMECRSLILDRTTYDVVSRKFNRFFNLGENPEEYTDFDWDHCHIMEKADGSLIGVYYNPTTDRFEISSRSQAKCELDHEVLGNWKTALLDAFGFDSEELFQVFFKNVVDATNITFVFEFISPLNRIVTPYEKTEMVFLGGTYYDGKWLTKDIMEYFMHSYFTLLNIRLPEFYDIPADTNALINLANNLPNLKEGFVLWDENSNKRIKLKSTAYLVAHRLRGEDTKPTRKNIFTLIFTGEADEFLVYFPEYKEFFDAANEDINVVNDELNEVWKSVKNITDQKEFAMKVKDHRLSAIFFMAKKNNLHPVQIFHNMPVDKKVGYFLI